ncbi:unnamed protein product [Adineta steineri]|uniref:Uncharacterized protein n=1 Tax=Adineta steineri TaxID=433720 RepID=A0A814XAC3_9BILA|nr:unnamed protein product [Adineta steineri]CAF1216674.1 unnamed protein product [Adineta steineri]
MHKILLTNTNEIIYPIWNTIAGGDSSVATPGDNVGNYYRDEKPEYALDQKTSTKYTNFGNCSSNFFSPTCGTNTGFYVTLARGASLLLAIQFCAAPDIPLRDPITITVEGSNETSSALNLGSSWTLIYSGSSGLDTDLGRYNCGILESISNNGIWYNSYRLLVTSIRGSATSTQYSEVRLFGY